jgi:hypothetical protein
LIVVYVVFFGLDCGIYCFAPCVHRRFGSLQFAFDSLALGDNFG